MCDRAEFSFSNCYQRSFLRSQSHRLRAWAQSEAVGVAITGSAWVNGLQGMWDSTDFSFSNYHQGSFPQSQSHCLQTLAQSAAVDGGIVAIAGKCSGATTATRSPGRGRVCLFW